MSSVYGRKAILDDKYNCIIIGLSSKDICGKITPVFVAEMPDGSVVTCNVTQLKFYPKYDSNSTQ